MMWANEISLGVVALLLCGTAVLAFILSEYDVLHPFTIVSFVLAFSAILSVLAPEKWHIYITPFAALIAVSAVLCFGMGALFSDWFMAGWKRTDAKLREDVDFSEKVILVSCVVLLLFFILNFWETYHAAILLGNQSGIVGMIPTIRHAVEVSEYEFPRFYVYRNYVAQAFVYYSILIFFQHLFSDMHTTFFQRAKYILPIFFYIPLLILSGARLGLFCIIIFMIVAGSIIYQKHHGFDISSKKRSLICAFVGGIAFFALFLLFGFFTGKVSLDGRSPFEIISHYGGLSLPALSVYLESTFLESPYIGTNTLFEVYRKLIFFGMDPTKLPEDMFHFLPFTMFSGIDTNVYTAMRRYIQDYGFFCMYLIMIFLGMIYTALYNYVRIYTRNIIYIGVYAATVWPLFWLMNDEGVLTGIFQTQTIYMILLMMIFDWIFRRESPKEMEV